MHALSSPKFPRIPLLLLLLRLLSLAASSDLSSDRAVLLALRSAVGGRTLFWNATSGTPCNWQGVLCENNRVTALRLPGSSLSGVLPADTLSNLNLLHTLSLRVNHLYGPLPSDLSRLSQLRNLYLQGNWFSGVVPDVLFSIHSLVRLNLASNSFSGEIPSGFNDLTRLRSLFLEENQFTGVLPDIELPDLLHFNVSFNNLSGTVPKGLAGKPKDAFLGTLLCGKPLDNACSRNVGETTGASPEGQANSGGILETSGKRKLSGGAIAGIVIGSVGFVLFLFALFVFCRKRNGQKSKSADLVAIKNQEQDSGEEPMVGAVNEATGNGFSAAAAAAAALGAKENAKSEKGVDMAFAKKLVFFSNYPRVFDLEDLLRASAEVLGKGTSGTTYKAGLEVGGNVVAVKRLKDVTITEREFKGRINEVGVMEHENLVPLRAYYYSRDEKLLVYDYMPMGSLSALLHGNKGAGRTPLNWERRFNIALGAARGIKFLHFQGPNFAHGNIKSSNILLTETCEAQVSDFGLNQLVGPPVSPIQFTGCRAPEVTDTRRVSQKADIYSFGVLILELLTGKAPTNTLLNEEGVDLSTWVQSVVQDEWTSEVFDLELLRYQDVEEEMLQLLQLGIDCTTRYPESRPSMSEVVKRIEELRFSDSLNGQEQFDHV